MKGVDAVTLNRKCCEERGLEIAGKLETGDFIGWEDDLSVSEASLYQPYPASCKSPKSHAALAC